MIKTANGPHWITVPVKYHSLDERIQDKAIDNGRDGSLRWGRKMALTIKYAYQRAPHFNEYAPRLFEILEKPWERLADLNITLLEFCRSALGLSTPIKLGSQLQPKGVKSEMILDLCKQVGADTYLAGAGGSKGYLDVESFAKAGVRVIWQDFRHPRYVQFPDKDKFVEKLSVVDLLFNCGPSAADLLWPRNKP
jgi:hypothetical protein